MWIRFPEFHTFFVTATFLLFKNSLIESLHNDICAVLVIHQQYQNAFVQFYTYSYKKLYMLVHFDP